MKFLILTRKDRPRPDRGCSSPGHAPHISTSPLRQPGPGSAPLSGATSPSGRGGPRQSAPPASPAPLLTWRLLALARCLGVTAVCLCNTPIKKKVSLLPDYEIDFFWLVFTYFSMFQINTAYSATCLSPCKHQSSLAPPSHLWCCCMAMCDSPRWLQTSKATLMHEHRQRALKTAAKGEVLNDVLRKKPSVSQMLHWIHSK